jgi:hypothetical protein
MSKDDPNNPFDNTYHKEDEVGPSWGEPYGCCFGECDTEFSIAFREYHGLTEAWAKFYEDMEKQRKYDWKKCRRKTPRKYGYGEMLSLMLSLGHKKLKSKHQLPRRLRYIFK